jgi:phage gp36-like protein
MPAYATPADLQVAFDWHEIGDLISDSNEQLSANDQLTNPNVLAALAKASGDIDVNLMVSGRYSSTDLSTLTDNSLAYLKAMVCRIAMCYIMERKPMFKPEVVKAYREWVDSYLKKLASGVNVFNLPAQISAGTPEASGLTGVQYNCNELNLVTDPNRMHYFPKRQLPFGRMGS